jgi:thymidine kinase
VAELIYFTGTMDSGKSTLALQTDHNHRSRGRKGLVFTSLDRAGSGKLSSRLGLEVSAIEVDSTLNFHRYVADLVTHGERIDYLICDEAQFYTIEQVNQLAELVDGLQIDVFAFGILTDFRTALFPGSARFVEIADRVNVLQVEALCWCGSRATHQARIVNGVMVVEGEQVVVGDTGDDVVAYEVLCRRHHMRKVTSRRSRDYFSTDIPLPFSESNSTEA